MESNKVVNDRINNRVNSERNNIIYDNKMVDTQKEHSAEQTRMELRKRQKPGMVYQATDRRIRDDRIRATTNRIIRAREERERKRKERATRYAKHANKTERTDYQAIKQAERERRYRRSIKQSIKRVFGAIQQHTNEIVKAIVLDLREMVMNELNQFKREINIAEIAQVFGYYIDKEKSSRAVKQLRNDQTGDKIVVSRNESNGHYIYFSMRDESNNGSVIDFIQSHTGKNLGRVRVLLRKWLKNEIQGEYEQIKIQKSNADKNKIFRIWEKIKNDKLFATSWRGIKGAIWEKIAEKNRIKITDDAIYFPMYDIDGICGIEKRTFDGEKRVISGSEKGLWSYGDLKTASYIVMCESPIDAISYKILNNKDFENKDVFLVATMGAFSDKQELSIREIVRRNNIAEWIIATDNDTAGDKLAGKIAENVKQVSRNINIYRHKSDSKDWNEELKTELRKSKNQSRSHNFHYYR